MQVEGALALSRLSLFFLSDFAIFYGLANTVALRNERE